jgi:hypothetical protein
VGIGHEIPLVVVDVSLTVRRHPTRREHDVAVTVVVGFSVRPLETRPMLTEVSQAVEVVVDVHVLRGSSCGAAVGMWCSST